MQISYDEGNVVLTEVRDFDLAQTLECGQCFHFKKLAEQEYAVCAFHRLLRIRQEKDSVILFDTAMQDYEMIWRDYFDFGRDYGRIKAALLQTWTDHVKGSSWKPCRAYIFYSRNFLKL